MFQQKIWLLLVAFPLHGLHQSIIKDVDTKTRIKVYRNQLQKIQLMWPYLVFINQYQKLVLARLEMFEIFLTRFANIFWYKIMHN